MTNEETIVHQNGDVAVVPLLPSGQKITPGREVWQRAARTFLQLVAAGGLTALTDQIASDLPLSYAPYLVIGYGVVISWAQNFVEEHYPSLTILKK